MSDLPRPVAITVSVRSPRREMRERLGLGVVQRAIADEARG